MKITPDYKDRNDQYDDTFRYYEQVDQFGYYYEIYAILNNEKIKIVITKHGVSVDFKDTGKSISTNIKPKGLFPDKEQLTWNELKEIIKILDKTDIEGYTRSKEEMEELYQEWVRLGEP